MDEPGSWHHVINRGIGKRPMFECRDDHRYFLSALARQVRAGRIEIHAYCLMTTHFHLLVRSPVGRLAEAMRQAQNLHSRRFNRRRRRDGALIRGRFFSRRVDSDEYRWAVVRYIDANPVHAGIVHSADEHEFGSARAYMGNLNPPWLTRSWVETYISEVFPSAGFDAVAYSTVFSSAPSKELAAIRELVEARMAARRPKHVERPLLKSAPESVRRWLRRKTRMADGLSAELPLCVPSILDEALTSDCRERGAWMVKEGKRTWDGAEIARIALLHEVCGKSWREIAISEGEEPTRMRRLYGTHQRLLHNHPEYSQRVRAIVRATTESLAKI